MQLLEATLLMHWRLAISASTAPETINNLRRPDSFDVNHGFLLCPGAIDGLISWRQQPSLLGMPTKDSAPFGCRISGNISQVERSHSARRPTGSITVSRR
jgi:hypothetical protein